ncbi:MAG: molybdopterin molybdenumtransferase MoeA [Lachnospiraceae bacterium]|nr:molybdopterin molybdenumtransferase MoeA [Lachnospiraceae bacterium]
MELLKVDTLETAREKLLAAVGENWIKTKNVPLNEALNGVLAEDVYGKIHIPDFRRSMVDGYAVIAKDTMGAGESLPVFLKVIGDVGMGEAAECVITPGTCAYVPTGGMIPEGADACVMVEYCEHFDSEEIAVYQATSVGRHVVDIGEDSKAGELLFKKGTKLRPQEIGALSAEGFTEVKIFAPVTISIISTGDELVAPGGTINKGQIYDINTTALQALAGKHGFEVLGTATVKDQYDLLKAAIVEAKENSDLVVVSGGSSKGKKDMTALLIDELADPGVFTHGLALKPGKPTILGADKESGTLMAGLPGHPVAAMAVFEMMLVWLKRELTCEPEKGLVPAVLSGNVPGAPGRQTLLFVELEQTEDGYLAKPIFGKSGLMSTMTRADGYTTIEMLQEGLKSGEKVWVHTF